MRNKSVVCFCSPSCQRFADSTFPDSWGGAAVCLTERPPLYGENPTEQIKATRVHLLGGKSWEREVPLFFFIHDKLKR